MRAISVDREDVLRFRFRFRRHGLHQHSGTRATDTSLLDYGVQDTGPDGAAWALAIRGAAPEDSADPADPDGLVFAWTVRAAPHAYRRSDLGAVAVATAPLSEADAAKRIFDASR